MRTLVLGGTVFLGHAVAAEAVRRGHEVVCAARGSSGPVPAGATLVPVDRAAPDGLAPLAGQKFDAVVDVATMSYPWVAGALTTLGAAAEHWTFVSSINVYADAQTPGQDEDAPLHPPRQQGADPADRIDDPYLYAGIKVASEQAVRAAMAERALVVRCGLIVGPGDVSDRFGYWPARLARGGRVVVPDVPDQPVQVVDVRDLAAWIVTAGEQRTGGTYNGVGPTRPFGQVLAEIAAAVAPPGTSLVPVPADVLDAAGVGPWRGPRSLPLWVPPEDRGFLAHDHRRAVAAGLAYRPFGQVVADALAHEQALGPDREREAGLSAAEEAEVLRLVEERR
jgi:2'-hydroxyisoflavone reductase